MAVRAVSTLLALATSACGASLPASSTAQQFTPDVPTWRGGCFLSGPAGKIVNASPAPDVRLFGAACSDPPGPGGLVYLDRFDPVSGAGDVTVISSAPGSAPAVIAKNGGGGSIEIGSTGASFDDRQSRVLTLASISYVAGDLVLAPLPSAAPVKKIASGVRVGNYEFLADGGAIYVGNYDATARDGDIFYWNDGTPQLLVSKASRFDFVMYRLAPDRARVAYLTGWKEQSGGDLFVQSLPPGPPPSTPIASGVYRMAWTADGHLVFRTVNPDGVTYALWVWDGNGDPRQIAPEVDAAPAIVGNSILFATGWSVLAQSASLHLVPAAGGPDAFGSGTAPAALAYSVAQPSGTPGVLAYVVPPNVTVPTTGTLFATPLSQLAPAQLDENVSVDAGFSLSPRARFVSYGVDQPTGSASPQPGIASDLRVAPASGGPPFVLAQDASTFVAWDPQERFAAAIGSFAPASNTGSLVVRGTPGGDLRFSQATVGNAQFKFAADGSTLWVIRAWDEALKRGELAVVPTTGASAWQATAVDQGVTFVMAPGGGRAIYGVQGGGRDGLWLNGP